MLNNPPRRAVLIGLGALALAPAPALALTESAAEKLVSRCVAEINKAVNSGKTGNALYREFERIFKTYADVPTIARYSLGPAARSASRTELRNFTNAFAPYMARKYGKQFRELIGGTIEIDRARTDRSFVVVETTAKLRGRSPFQTDFLVSDRSGSDRIFNVIVEGVNMLTTERSEVTAMLDAQGGSIAKLTSALKSAG
ncbi:MAG: ABC transporter substrate-binding protein [Mangrovicoccus sp.]|nr:ABC transporter substrate-binding protein [Mangrovicoccus sp.]